MSRTLAPTMSTPPNAPELTAVRNELATTDRDLVALLGQRMRLIREVARVKGEKGLPSFDREREGAHLDELVERGREAGVPDDLVRDVYARLFAASRLEQRRFLQAKADHFSIGIIGGTQGMGAFLAKVFAAGGYPVEVMGLVDPADAEAANPAPTAKDVASRNDVVIVAVPIQVTVQVIEEIAPHVKKGACIIDITSIKRAPLEAMMRAAPEGVDVVATHPMFGPHGVDFDRQKVVLCRGRGEEAFTRVKKLYEGFGAETIEATAEEHDAQMALIQVLVHEKTMVLGSVLERLKADLGRSLQFASPIYRTELAMIGRMFSQRAELYADILTVNPEAPRLSHVFEQEAAHFVRAVAMSDRESVVTRFRQVAAYMKDFASWAKKQSDAILDDLVRHG